MPLPGCEACTQGWIEIVEVLKRNPVNGEYSVVQQRRVILYLNDPELGYEKLWAHEEDETPHLAVKACSTCQPEFVPPSVRHRAQESLDEKIARTKKELDSAESDDLLPDRKLWYGDKD